ncbi:MAG: hypothetical protein J0M33_22975 [Anaerolineae bacterium]|nr:hypothetical protein [Anaerolineae bacterium]
MSRSSVLEWPDGSGWLVLAGGPDTAIRGQAIQRMAAGGVVVYVNTGQGSDTIQEDMEDLGAPTGYILDILSEDDETIQQQMADANLIVLGGDDPPSAIRSALIGPVASAIRQGFERGSVLLCEGPAAAVWGTWMVDEVGTLLPGLDWLPRSIVLPGVTSAAGNPLATRLLAEHPNALLIGPGTSSALSLGPEGAVEAWGARQVMVALGREYST